MLKRVRILEVGYKPKAGELVLYLKVERYGEPEELLAYPAARRLIYYLRKLGHHELARKAARLPLITKIVDEELAKTIEEIAEALGAKPVTLLATPS